MRTTTLHLGVVALGLWVAACSQGGGASGATTSPATPASPAVATVNGTAITEAELSLLTSGAGHPGAADGDRRKTALEALVRDELLKQKALELKLAPDGPAAAELARLEAQVAVARRRAYADAYQKQLARSSEPTEADAKAFFEQNRALYASEYHVEQLFVRDEAAITALAQELATGASFVDVARRQYPTVPVDMAPPWDLGFLPFRMVPEWWRPELAKLQPGQVSGVIRGPSNRFWIIRLVEKREKAEVKFEDLKPEILESLKRSRVEQATNQAEAELRKSARITQP